MNWYEKYQAGLLGPISTNLGAMSETFEEAVSEWHHSDSELELHEFLGLTSDQYQYTLWFPERRIPTPEQAEWFSKGQSYGFFKGLNERL